LHLLPFLFIGLPAKNCKMIATRSDPKNKKFIKTAADFLRNIFPKKDPGGRITFYKITQKNIISERGF